MSQAIPAPEDPYLRRTTSHELAKDLLAGEDLPVVIRKVGEGFVNYDHVWPKKRLLYDEYRKAVECLELAHAVDSDFY